MNIADVAVRAISSPGTASPGTRAIDLIPEPGNSKRHSASALIASDSSSSRAASFAHRIMVKLMTVATKLRIILGFTSVMSSHVQKSEQPILRAAEIAYLNG